MTPNAFYTADYLHRNRLVKENKDSSVKCQYEGCLTPLAADNRDAGWCGPCQRKWADEHPNESLPAAALSREESKQKKKYGPRSGDYLALPGLRGVMNDRGLSYAKLGRKSGLCHGNLRNWALGKSKAPEKKAIELARALGVSVEELKGEN